MVYVALLSPGFTLLSTTVNPYESTPCRAGQTKAKAKITGMRKMSSIPPPMIEVSKPEDHAHDARDEDAGEYAAARPAPYERDRRAPAGFNDMGMALECRRRVHRRLLESAVGFRQRISPSSLPMAES